jgi:3-oxoacyl-[acyl-carrier-protein] synthase-3
MSKLNLWENSLMLFGDAAGAVVVEKDNNFTWYGIQGEYSKTFPQYFSDLYYQNELSANNEDLSSWIFTMNGQNVYSVWINTVTEMMKEYIEKNNLIMSNFNYIIPHQANKRMLDKIWKNLWYDNEKILKTIAENGNTSSASPFLTLSKHQDKLKNWDRILLLSLWAWFNVTLIDIVWGH